MGVMRVAIGRVLMNNSMQHDPWNLESHLYRPPTHPQLPNAPIVVNQRIRPLDPQYHTIRHPTRCFY